MQPHVIAGYVGAASAQAAGHRIAGQKRYTASLFLGDNLDGSA